jgi:23S rRNA U2552 (ribose-2'-O)-methylase RlmE/FtsJ
MSKNIKLDTNTSNYIPVIYKFENNSDIFKHKVSSVFSSSIDYPKFSYGFHHYIHQSKDKMEITQQFEDKKKVYYVLSKFERHVDDFDTDIDNVSKAYFDISPKPNILSRAFFKLWEILFMFDLVPTDESNFVSAHLAEGPGSFIQATMFYRDKFCKKGLSKNDKYHAITLHSDKLNKHVPPLEDSFTKYYTKQKPERVIQHKTYPIEISRLSKLKDNGDLTDPKTINLFGGNFKKNKAQFITADGGFNWVDENTQEQEAFKLILGQIITALKIQDKGGNFVCKFFESFTKETVKLIVILLSFYEEVYAVKPLTSRESNSEKYFVCKKFKDSKDNVKKIAILESILKDSLKFNEKFIIDLFPSFKLTEDFNATLIKMNIEIANKQLILINDMVGFIKEQNYRGDKYHSHREDQINATKFWTDTFFPTFAEFADRKKQTTKFSESIVNENIENINRFKKKLV